MSDTNPESEILQEIESMQPNTDLITNAPEGSQLISGEIEGGLFSTIISILKKLLFWQTETDETLKTHRHDSDYEPKDPSLQAQKHTHGNKSTLDKITLAMVNTWNALVSFPGFAANGSATAGKAVEATDNRLSNARPPTAHSHTNADLPPYPTLSSLGGATAGHNHDSTYEPKDATLQAQKHTHGNKSVLDQISTALFTKWCTLISFPGFAANGSATAGKAVEATDSRLSDARPPTAHSHTNADLPPYPTLAGLGGAAANHNHDASYEAKDTSLQAQKHTHSNKSVLDGITSVLINKWNALLSFPGFATNGSATAGKAVEATDGRLSNARTPTAHTHAIGDLPAYPTLSSLGGATANHNHDASYEPKDATLQSQKHTHSNKSVLDGITSALINKWNTVINFPGFASNGYTMIGRAVEANDFRLLPNFMGNEIVYYSSSTIEVAFSYDEPYYIGYNGDAASIFITLDFALPGFNGWVNILVSSSQICSVLFDAIYFGNKIKPLIVSANKPVEISILKFNNKFFVLYSNYTLYY